MLPPSEMFSASRCCRLLILLSRECEHAFTLAIFLGAQRSSRSRGLADFLRKHGIIQPAAQASKRNIRLRGEECQ